ncbi:PLP-dependent aminotransferase family protein [Glutamicibacter sp.]|uniref:MocR-like pyridoxine biosynthesis transcription factor PdxR n=1 Tax=Glutamicibacter sp. TaxID=1931995 RepID=UPI0028BD6D23|nr:PLP-dependent aminotransferase family protein [Glutamicibacter sp.]
MAIDQEKPELPEQQVLAPISISSESPEPLYRQLRLALEHQIHAGTIVQGLPLPSSRELSRELGLSRNTVNAALQELLASGLIESHARRGYFVNSQLLGRQPPAQEGTSRNYRPLDLRRHIKSWVAADSPEITKISNWRDYPYPFVAGQVEESDFPRLAWARALRDSLDPPHLHFALRDSVDEDDPYLVEMLCQRVLPARGIIAAPENILITAGSQQGLDLLAQTIMNDETTVAVEDPGYVDARHTFARTGASVLALPVDAQGVVPPDSFNGIDAFYLTPSHHSPTNVTLSASRRRSILDATASSGTIIIEDDYDSEFRYRGKPTPALKALTNSAHVVYLGSFTKFLAPGLRMGYVVADPQLVEVLRSQRRYRIRHIAGHPQRAMALMIDSGQYQRTISRRRTQLQRKWSKLTESLDAHLSWKVNAPPGGVTVWIKGPAQLDCRLLMQRCLRQGVVIERGDVFFSNSSAHRNYFRLGFAAINVNAIDPGVRRLATVLNDMGYLELD